MSLGLQAKVLSQMHPMPSILSISMPVKIMGILNVTPDSFSDGGVYYGSEEKALAHALQMLDDGADIIDIGGESTRPYAAVVTPQEELDRVIPILEQLRKQTDKTLSVDTSQPEVIKAAIAAGADMINDVRALSLPGALAAVSSAPKNIMVCLNHTPAEPSVMQEAPFYEDVVAEVYQFLESRIKTCIAAGMNKNQLIIDPGIGFGKTTRHNVQLLHRLEKFQSLGMPILIGISRKKCIGDILKKPVNQRLYGSIAAAVVAFSKGASIIRTHDVKPTVEALTVASAILNTNKE